MHEGFYITAFNLTIHKDVLYTGINNGSTHIDFASVAVNIRHDHIKPLVILSIAILSIPAVALALI